MARAVVTVQPAAKRGEIVEIKTLAQHTMETGFRRTQTGEIIPRDIIRTFTCTYNGIEVCRVDLHPAIAANPLIAFTTVATESGTLQFRWVGDNGYTVTEIAPLKVE
jgi:sulfur-oxidizing protein SoxZ